MNELSAMLAQVIELQQASAARIEAVGQSIAALQAAIDALESGSPAPDLIAQAKQALAQAQSNDAALSAITA